MDHAQRSQALFAQIESFQPAGTRDARETSLCLREGRPQSGVVPRQASDEGMLSMTGE